MGGCPGGPGRLGNGGAKGSPIMRCAGITDTRACAGPAHPLSVRSPCGKQKRGMRRISYSARVCVRVYTYVVSSLSPMGFSPALAAGFLFDRESGFLQFSAQPPGTVALAINGYRIAATSIPLLHPPASPGQLCCARGPIFGGTGRQTGFFAS